jgi:hypothetical protein
MIATKPLGLADAMLQKLRQKHQEERGMPDELNQYLDETLAPTNTDVLAYWRSKEVVWPTLSAMARDHLAVPATSASSERAFSAGADLHLDGKRNSLNTQAISAILLQQNWLRNGLMSHVSS